MADKEAEEKVEEKPESTEETPKETLQETPKEAEDESKKLESAGEVDEKAKDITKDEIIPELTNEYKLPGAGENRPINHKSFKKVLIGAVIVLILALVGAGALWMTHDDPVSDSNSEVIYYQGSAVTAVEGDVEFNSGSGWNAAEQGTQLEEGYSLRTLGNSRAVITLDEGSAVRLDSDSVVTITKLTADEVVIDNASGHVYARVVPSETRVFSVTVDGQAYAALGTAFQTVNEKEEKGVEVYHSKVDVKNKTEVNAGEAYFTLSKDEARNGKVTKLDLEKLKSDDFINWNKTKDEANDEFANELGILKDLKDGKEEKEETTPPPTNDSTRGISVSATKVDDGIKVTWSVDGISITEGFKVTYSKSDTTPTYGENSAQYVSPDKTSTVLGLYDGKSYFIRVCAYRGDKQCDSYSKTVSATAPQKEVTRGDMTASLGSDGYTLNWSYTGEATFGYKVNWSTTDSPQYGADGTTSKLVTWGTSLNLNEIITETGIYYVSVCAYTGSGCVDYSADVEFTR